MRIDKYLWAIRAFKTRNQAAEACKKGQVKLNGANAKPSKEVFGGESIGYRKNQMNIQIEVLDIPKSRVGAKLVPQYLNDVTPKEELEKLDLLKYARDSHRKKGEGRPTKKDRRDIDEYQDSDNYE